MHRRAARDKVLVEFAQGATGMVRSDPPSNRPYWVYVNDGRKRGAIHRGDCGNCNYGAGKFGGGSRSNGYWRSFEDRESAHAFAREVGYADLKSCSFCGG